MRAIEREKMHQSHPGDELLIPPSLRVLIRNHPASGVTRASIRRISPHSGDVPHIATRRRDIAGVRKHGMDVTRRQKVLQKIYILNIFKHCLLFAFYRHKPIHCKYKT